MGRKITLLEINDQDIDVKDIMHRIKDKLGKYNMTEDISEINVKLENSFSDSQIAPLLEQLAMHTTIINRSWNISAENAITSHRKGIGSIIVVGKKIVRKLLRWYINPVVDVQTEFNANVTRTINSLLHIIDQQNKLNSLATQNHQSLVNEFTKISLSNVRLSASNQRLSEQLEGLLRDKSSYDVSIQDLKSTVNHTTTRIQDLLKLMDRSSAEKQDFTSLVDQANSDQNIRNEYYERLSVQNTEMHSNIRISNERLRRIERTLRSKQMNIEGNLTTQRKVVDGGELDFDYFLFEEYYRGSREEIMDLQRQYIPYFLHSHNVLDLGCGRGEFTELLLEQDVKVTSVDLNDDMVAYCKDRGFNIIQADAIEYLNSLEDQSVDGIFMGQVIEHLSPSDLIVLVKLAYAKLKPNSWFVAETPNPRSLSIFAQSFYMDLTHTKPVHPFTAKFIWETEGFRDIDIKYFSPNNPILKIPELNVTEMNNDTMKQFNTALSHWNEILFGNQDYFIAGKK